MLNPLTFRYFFCYRLPQALKRRKSAKCKNQHLESNTQFQNLCIFYKITLFNNVVKKSLTLFVFNKID